MCARQHHPPESSFIHAFVQLLIVLFGLRPGIIPAVSSHQPKSFLSLGSFIFSLQPNLAILLEIPGMYHYWYYWSDLAPEGSGNSVIMSASLHFRFPFRFAIYSLQQPSENFSCAAWGRLMPPVRRGRERRSNTDTAPSWDQLSGRASEASELPLASPVLYLNPRDFFLSCSWLPTS